MTLPTGRGLRAWLLAAGAGAGLLAGGCENRSGIYDPYALSQAKRVAVLPAVGAPGVDGDHAGRMQSGLLITALSNLKHYEVQGPANLRKALQAEANPAPWSRQLQADLAKRLGIDLFVLGEVADYRFTKEWKSSSFLIGTSQWTETTYHTGVNVRLVAPADGRLVYAGSGAAKSKQGYGPAVVEATDKALAELKQFLMQQEK